MKLLVDVLSPNGPKESIFSLIKMILLKFKTNYKILCRFDNNGLKFVIIVLIENKILLLTSDAKLMGAREKKMRFLIDPLVSNDIFENFTKLEQIYVILHIPEII